MVVGNYDSKKDENVKRSNKEKGMQERRLKNIVGRKREKETRIKLLRWKESG